MIQPNDPVNAKAFDPSIHAGKEGISSERIAEINNGLIKFTDGILHPNSYIFTQKVNGENVEVIVIKEGKFYFKGEEIQDVHNVYEKFKQYLDMMTTNFKNK